MTIDELRAFARALETYDTVRTDPESAGDAAADVLEAFRPLRREFPVLDGSLERELCKARMLLVGATVPTVRRELARTIATIRVELVEGLVRRVASLSSRAA